VSGPTPRRWVAPLRAIAQHGVMLVYPQKGKKDDPPSLWHALYPRSAMRWAWDADADPRVSELWHLRDELTRSGRVVYGKWFAGRATFFSRDLFRAMLAHLRAAGDLRAGLSLDAQGLLAALEDDSPRLTRALRQAAELEGRTREAAYARAMRVLWSRLLIVGAGEVEDGGFPSLAVGATSVLCEDVWEASRAKDAKGAALLARVQASSPSFARAFARVERSVVTSPASTAL
jgi:hypothetical protein